MLHIILSVALHFLVNNILRRIADIYRKLRSTTSKLQKTASGIAFTEHALHHHVTPKFADLKRQFLQTEDKMKAERSISKNVYPACLDNMTSKLPY